MSIDYLFYSDWPLTPDDVEAAVLAGTSFHPEPPFGGFTCLAAAGVSAQMRQVSGSELTILFDNEPIKLPVKFEILFNISKFDIPTGESNMLDFIKKMHIHDVANCIIFNNEDNGRPLVFFHRGKIYSYNIDIFENLGNALLSKFDGRIDLNKKLEIIY
jgi:hypothetical protein